MDILTRYPALPTRLFSITDDFGLTFYAISYAIGAGLALALASWRAGKEGYPRDFFLNLFLVAFPMGIIGGRVWYVIASWNDFAADPFNLEHGIFAIWKGGLAIQGGALFGIVSGIVFVKLRRKGVPLLQVCDWAVPAILVAQMIGRWGNFFNAEVYGNIVDTGAYGWLPAFVLNQMGYAGPAAAPLPDAQMFVPLFLIEGLMNVAGYFVLTHGLEQVLARHRVYGDGTFAYFVWYGVTRIILEPLRYATFNMSSGGYMQALAMAYVFVAIGAVLLVANHIGTRLREKGLARYPAWLAGFLDNGYVGSRKL